MDGERTREELKRGHRRILLLDCDAFFVQVAQLEDPEGAGRARLLLVGGSASGRGVVTSASYEARTFGVHSAMPMAEALRLCPDALVVPVPRGACSERSRAIREVLGSLSPVVQAASIDEFYLDLSGTERLLRSESLAATARRIRERVLDQTDISVSIGGGTGRLVAKLAAGRAKPAGVHIVPPGEEASFLTSFELSQIPGVGPTLLEALNNRGLKSVRDLVGVEEAWLRRWFGEARGRWLWERSRGIDPSPVVAEEERKSISSERTFHTDLADPDLLERHLLQLVLSVGESMRGKGLSARTVTVKVRDADFRTRQSSQTIEQPLESDRLLFELAREMVRTLRKRRSTPTRLIGVGVSNFDAAGGARQLSMLDEHPAEESDRDRTLSRLGDELRARFGREALLPGRIIPDPSTDRRIGSDPGTRDEQD
ncbi:MAG: DNA polymerase IV [Gemmatimonadales bacterium]|nr:MAG: DNA polymerase IV [Gemmatimonadales bacterium]